MENHIFRSVSVLPCIIVSVLGINFVPVSVHSQSL
jgi:hypothetical protein